MLQAIKETLSRSLVTYAGKLEHLKYYPGRIKATFRLTPESQRSYEMKLRALESEKAAALKAEKLAYEKALTALHWRYRSQALRIESAFLVGVHDLFVAHVKFSDAPLLTDRATELPPVAKAA